MFPHKKTTPQTGNTVSRRSVVGGLAGVAGAALLAAPAAASGLSPRTLYIAGDSTASIKHPSARPEAGWGMALPYFATPHVRIANRAVNGRSSKSFIDQGRLESIAATLAPGDTLLVQFGHNDSKPDTERYTDPWGTYQRCLSRYVEAARSAGAKPVFATSIERRRFRSDGTAYSTLGDYPEAMRELGIQLGVPVLDLQAQSLALWQRLGPEETKRYFLHTEDGRRDNTHLQPLGASTIANLAANGLSVLGELAPHETRRLDELVVPESEFIWSQDAVLD